MHRKLRKVAPPKRCYGSPTNNRTRLEQTLFLAAFSFWAYGVMAAAQDLESCGVIRGGSSPSMPTIFLKTINTVMQFEKLVNNILLNEWSFDETGDPSMEDLNLSDYKTYTIYSTPWKDWNTGEDVYSSEFQLSDYSLKELKDSLELLPFFESPVFTAATGEEGDVYFEGNGFALKKAGELFAKIGRLKNINYSQKERLFSTEMTDFLQAHKDLLKHTDVEEQEDITKI